MKNVLLDKGIILPSGEISKDKVNLGRRKSLDGFEWVKVPSL